MAGYIRTDTTNNIADGNVINATDLDNEFDAIQAAFNVLSGHNHDGTTGEGSPILALGPAQDVVVSSTAVTPKTTATLDLGTPSLKFKDLNLSGDANIAGTVNGTTIPSTKTLVTTVDTQTLTNKTIEGGTFTNGYTEESVTANTSTAYTIDLANGTLQILTLTGNCTFTFPSAVVGKSFMLLLKQDGTGSRTVTWPASVKWPSSIAPTVTTTASRLDKYVFTSDGTNWYGSNAGQNYTV